MPFIQANAFVLKRKIAGESMLHLRLITEMSGLLHVYRRIRSKPSSGDPLPDLFDHLDAVLETRNEGRTWFLKEFAVIRRHSGIGKNYHSLDYASRFASIILNNPLHDDACAPHFESLGHALSAWENGRHPEIIYLKTLYLYAREEGFPVREDWIKHLPSHRQREAIELIHLPLIKLTDRDAAGVEKLIESLEKWLRGYHDLHM